MDKRGGKRDQLSIVETFQRLGLGNDGARRDFLGQLGVQEVQHAPNHPKLPIAGNTAPTK